MFYYHFLNSVSLFALASWLKFLYYDSYTDIDWIFKLNEIIILKKPTNTLTNRIQCAVSTSNRFYKTRGQ